jgi:hypothetical protein
MSSRSIELNLPALTECQRHRATVGKLDSRTSRLWRAFQAPMRSDQTLLSDLDTAVATDPNSTLLRG